MKISSFKIHDIKILKFDWLKFYQKKINKNSAHKQLSIKNIKHQTKFFIRILIFDEKNHQSILVKNLNIKNLI